MVDDYDTFEEIDRFTNYNKDTDYGNRKTIRKRISLKNPVGKLNIRTLIKCFDGWNRRGLGNHIGKVLGLKNDIFRIYTNGENELLRSVWYHGDVNHIQQYIKQVLLKDRELILRALKVLKS
jgi:hypothetical protein